MGNEYYPQIKMENSKHVQHNQRVSETCPGTSHIHGVRILITPCLCHDRQVPLKTSTDPWWLSGRTVQTDLEQPGVEEGPGLYLEGLEGFGCMSVHVCQDSPGHSSYLSDLPSVNLLLSLMNWKRKTGRTTEEKKGRGEKRWSGG